MPENNQLTDEQLDRARLDVPPKISGNGPVNLDDLFTSDDRLLYTEIAFAQHVRGTLKWHEGKTFAMARIERTIKRMTFAIVVKRDEPRTPGLLPAIRVHSAEEVEKMIDWKVCSPHRDEIRKLLNRILTEDAAC